MRAAVHTRDQLFTSALLWMANRVDAARNHHFDASARAAREQSWPKAWAQGFNPSAVPRPKRIDQARARTRGEQKLEVSEITSAHIDLPKLAEAICAEWKQTGARGLAVAWLTSAPITLEADLIGDEQTLATLIGIAAAAAVVAVVIFVRRGAKASLPALPSSPQLQPSADFLALRSVATGDGEAATIAVSIRDSAREPWAWMARDGILKLADGNKRTLLEAFAASDSCGVSRIWPAAGEAFVVERMATAARTPTDDRWVVSAPVNASQVGYLMGTNVVLRANVDVCTIDWWLLSSPNCPVGNAIKERVDDLIAGGKAGASGWRAPWGLAHPEDLRELFDEAALDTWRKRMVAELNPYYSGRAERCLSIIGASGDVFESQIMETAGAAPIGDAVVEEVILREGERQHGLACRGGSPLLVAIVRTRPPQRGSQ